MTQALEPYSSHAAFVQAVRRSTAAHFAARGLAVREDKDHVLSRSSAWRENLLLPEVCTYIDAEVEAGRAGRRSRFTLNGQKHYGTSSQALLFNLVGPLIVRRDLEPLRVACAGAGIPWPDGASATFEVENPEIFNERHGQPTSIDLVVRGATPGPADLYVEAKFTEAKFGGCSVLARGQCETHGESPLGDLSQCYLHHIDHRYWQQLEAYGLIDETQRAAPDCMLGVQYQFYRELLFALASGGVFVLLYDARNPIFMGTGHSLLPTLIAQVPPRLHERVKALSIQQVVAAIRASGRHDDWIGEFAEKYGLD
jgi:POLQ-like helicase